MKDMIISGGIFAVVLVLVMVASIPIEREKKRRLQRYWDRLCTGGEWRSHFPEAPKEDIRTFLQTFVDGFAFKDRQRLKFSPDDKVMDVYRALYPSTGWPDSLELETFAVNLEKTYQLDTTEVVWPEITLGGLFAMTRNPNQQLQLSPLSAAQSELRR